MKTNKTLTLLLALLMLCSFTLGAFAESEPVVAADESAAAEVTETDGALAEWTVMCYFCGTDLETQHGMASTNLYEIAETVPNDSVNVVIQTGGAKEWHAQEMGLELEIDPDKTQRYHYDENGFVLDEDLPLQNMASADTLTDFVQYASERFPAQKYLLVLWDHGGGSLGGLILDERHQEAIMSLDQLELALSRSGVQFEATMLDTCLMASLETAQALQSSTHYFIASEEYVPGMGTDYYSWLQYLYDMPECDGRLFGRRICDSVQQKYAELGAAYDAVTFSLIDLTRLDGVVTAFNAMFKELRESLDDPITMREFGKATVRTESYLATDMLDIGDLVTRARGKGVSNRTANALLSALADAVIYNVRGVDHSYSTGLSFYYAPTAAGVYLDHFARFCKNAEYLAFIDRLNIKWAAPGWVYEQVEYLPDVTYDNYIVETSSTVNEDGSLQLSITNAGDAVHSLGLTLYAYRPANTDTEGADDAGIWLCLGNDSLGVEASSVPNVYTAAISGRIPTIGDVPCELNVVQENADYTLYRLPIRIEGEGKDSNLLVMYRFNASLDYQLSGADETTELSYDGSYSILGVQATSNHALPSRSVGKLDKYAGREFAALYTEVNFPSGQNNGTEPGDVQVITGDLAIGEAVLEPGRYAAAFYIRDVFGNVTTTEMKPFTWDGEKAVFEVPEDEQPVEAAEAEEAPAETETETAA